MGMAKEGMFTVRDRPSSWNKWFRLVAKKGVYLSLIHIWIQLSYLRLENGSSFHLDNERHRVSEISVKGLPGQLLSLIHISSDSKLAEMVTPMLLP